MDIPQAGLLKDCEKNKNEEELLMEELENQRLESTRLYLVNRNYSPPWLHTPFPESSHIPQVENQVSMMKDPRIYDQNSGEVIGMMGTDSNRIQTKSRQ